MGGASWPHNRRVNVDETIIDLLRYGKPAPGHRFADSLNDPLRAIGWSHLRGATRIVAPWQEVISPPAESCREVANRLARQYRVSSRTFAGFSEMDFGPWQAQELDELMANPDSGLQRFWANPLESNPPGDEPLVEFQGRVLATWNQLLDDCGGQHILMVCPASVQRVLVGMALGKPLQEVFLLATPYAGLSRISVVKEGDLDYRATLLFQSGVS